MTDPTPPPDPAALDPAALERVAACERPHPRLLLYYALFSLILGPLFPVLLIPGVLRYRTLRYRFDDDGVSMRWGALRRREVNLSYQRIQDIHLTSNLLERWLGLARVQVQTASGSHKPEMTIEGLPEFEAVRSFLAARMRGARHGHEGERGSDPLDGSTAAAVARSLDAAAQELRALRPLLERCLERGDG